MASNNEDEMEGLEAEHVYLLMSHKYRISRNSRAEWYFSNLDKFIRVPKCQSVEEYKDDLDVVSVIPADPPADWDSDTSHLYRYRVSPDTQVTYLARVYRLVFCLDLSPSVATVDTVSGMSLLEAVFPSVKRCLEGVTRPFYVPGSELLYKPMLYITVIAHTPFFTSQAHQVLVQGWMLTQENLESFLSTIEAKLEDIEDKFAEVSTLAKQQLEMQRLESERMMGKLFEDEPAEGSGCAPAVPMVSPDIGFVNMLRYGILALQLLPVKSGAGLVVVTDGAIALPDATLFDSLLVQLRNNTVACSFLQLGSGAQLDSPLGILPYTDLMQFLATATCGALLSHLPPVDHDYEYTMNVYHHAFLSWGFQKSSAAPEQTHASSHTRSWSIPRTAGDVPDPPQDLISKRQSVGTLNASLKSVLSCRLREGYIIRQVHIQDDSIRINLVLPWKHSIFIEYLLKSPWPPDGETVHFDLSILANYDFLHDVMCSKTTRTKSLYRRAMFNKFWINLKSLRHSDQLLVHLHSFNRSPPPYTVPEPVRRGNPLFYMSDDTGVLEPFSREPGLQALCNFWRPVCMLDINIWEKWMHAHRIGLLLEHDHPLPKHLFLPNNSGRHHSVQCRQATKAVTTMLAEISDFALMDGHSYIKFLYKEEGEPPVSFYMLRVNMVVRPPCMVVRLAFLGGTPGDLRYQIVNELRCRILSLTFTEGHTTLSLDPPIRKSAQLIERSPPSHSGGLPMDLPSTDKRPSVHYNSARPATQEVKCCILLQKPVEKFLIRYDRVPQNFLVAAIQRTYPAAATFRRPLPCHTTAVSSQNKTASAMFNILSRYLHHRRWVWDMQDSSGFPVSMNAMGRILSAIVKSRLREGFSFAHSSSGIINLVLEMEMEGPAHGRSEPLQTHPCVLQYVVFPPNVATPSGSRDNLSQSDDELAESDLGSSEADGESQIITECWIEPQSGLLVDRQQMRFDRLTYDQAAAKFYEMDRECISTLLTLEYLSMMCDVQSGTRVPSPDGGLSRPQPCRPDGERGTQRVGFCFDLPGLLNHCQQVEIILSTYVQDLSGLVLPQPVVGETSALGDTDAANCLLFQLLLETLQTLHQREVKLHPHDFRSIPTLIAARQRPANRPDPPFQAELDGRLPAWRCFVKCISRTHAVVTLLPASYADLKLLASTRLDGGHAVGGGVPGSSACQLVPADAEQCLRSLFGPDSRADSLANSSHGSASLRHRSGSVSAQLLAHAACPDSSQSPTATTSSGSAAASSPVSSEQQLMLQRDRARSVGSEAAALALAAMVGGGGRKTVTLVETGAGAGCVPTGEERPARALPLSGPQRRSRNPSSPSKLHAGDWERGAFPHRSCSFPNSEAAAAAARRRQAGSAAGAQAESLPAAGGRNSSCALLGSLNLPIYVYDCPLRSLTQLLSHADDAARGSDVYRDERFILSDRPLDGGPVTLGRYYSRSSDAEEPQYISEHCDVLQMAHTRAFVVGIFRLMQRSQLIHPLDVQSAIDVCDEQPLEVDITNFLKMICGHVRDFDAFSSHQLSADFAAAAADDVPPSAGRPFPLSVLLSHQPCEQLRIVHSEVKRRFDRILATNFGLAPGTNAVYYYLTPALRTSADDGASLPDDDPEYVPSADEDITVVQFGDIEASAVWRGVRNQDAESRSLATRTSQTSLISNVGSDSGADLEDRAEQVVDEPEEDTMPPLFLQLTCSVRAGSECFTHHVRRLPTCIGELVLGLKARQIHLDTLQVTLDILCLTLPDQLHTRIQDHANHQVRATSFCSDGAGSSDVPDMCSDTTSITDENSFVTSQLGQLTDYQLQAVTATRTELQWLLVDEMASLMLTICPVKPSSLTSVVDHVRRSAGQIQCPFPRRSCVHKQVPLNFVFGASQSIPKFLEHFGRFSVPGYKLAQLEDLYYLVHENSVSEPLMHSSLVPPLPPPHNVSPTDTQQSALALLRCRSFSNDDVIFRVKLARSISSDDFSHKLDIRARGDTAGSSCAAAGSSSSSTGDGGRRQRRSTSRRQTSGGPRPATDTPMTLEDREVATLLTDADRSPESQHPASVTVSTEQTVPRVVRCRSAGEMYDGPRSRPSHLSRLPAPTAMREDGGYDGDHSDADQDTRDEAAHALLPNFWLIVSVSNGMVDAYFHCRYRQENLLDNMKILDDVIARINAMCKLVNQVLLLENLEATRMCNNLLEPESSEDIWSKVNQDSFSTDVCEPNYLEANMQFRPGHFACPLVWSTTFPLHPRLRGPSGTPSPGLAFLRQALETLAVANRRNMFVLKDTLHGEHVFYLRLRDTWEIGSGHPSGDSNSGGALGDERSRYSLSAASQEMRSSRTTISTDRHTSASSRADSDDGVQLCVHGISEPNESIHRDLVDSMRNRLDDRLLEMIAMALLRNPQTKLTPDDVHFIQTPGEMPQRLLKYTLPPSATLHMSSVLFHLRKNLLQLLHLPKYTDNRIENQLRNFGGCDGSEMYLYVPSEKRGSRGMAVVSVTPICTCPSPPSQGPFFPPVSVVPPPSRDPPLASPSLLSAAPFTSTLSDSDDGDTRDPIPLVFSFDTPPQQQLPLPAAAAAGVEDCHQQLLGHWRPEMFEQLTHTELLPDSTDEEYPAVWLMFNIWEKCRVNVDWLEERLPLAVRYALWDLCMEQYVLPWRPVISSSRDLSSSFRSFKTLDDVPMSALSRILERRISSPVVQDVGVSATCTTVAPGTPLQPVYGAVLQRWLEFGSSLAVPSLKHCTVNLNSRHMMGVFLTELVRLVGEEDPSLLCSLFRPRQRCPGGAGDGHDETSFDSCDMDELTDATCDGYLLVGYGRREDGGWTPHRSSLGAQMSTLGLGDQDSISSSLSVPHSPALTPGGPAPLKTPSESMASPLVGGHAKHKLVWARVADKQVLMFTYNWPRDKWDYLRQRCLDLCQWSNARSALLHSILMQKLGLFHNQPFTRKQRPLSDKNAKIYINQPAYVSHLIRCTAPPSQLPSIGGSVGGRQVAGRARWLTETLRDCRPAQLQQPAQSCDAALRHGQQLIDVYRANRKADEQKKLYQQCQSPELLEKDVSVQSFVQLVRDSGRLLHFCFTPLLFLPSWRWQTAVRRDQAVPMETVVAMETAAAAAAAARASGRREPFHRRLRHVSESERSVGRPSPRLRRLAADERWHETLCGSLVREFLQYLQTIGFLPLQCGPQSASTQPTATERRAGDAPPRRSTMSAGAGSTDPPRPAARQRGPPLTGDAAYLHRAILPGGGYLLFEVGVDEPYFYVKLYALEGLRPEFRSRSSPVNLQTFQTFLSECDEIRAHVHLHSYMHDHHLRTMHQYIHGRPLVLRQGLHITSFLEDFYHYYPKGPSHARNFMTCGSMVVENLGAITTDQLYNYLLAHEKRYQLRVLRMIPLFEDLGDEMSEDEYVLVRVTSVDSRSGGAEESRVYDLTLVVSRDSADRNSTGSRISLRFYLLLTSRREMYPTMFVERKFENYRRVDTAPSVLPEAHSPVDSPASVAVAETVRAVSVGCTTAETAEKQRTMVELTRSGSEHINTYTIRPEPVHYLGYFSSHEKFMQTVLCKEVDSIRNQIISIVERAKVHCRRDSLWQRLKDEDKNSSGLCCAELAELLSLLQCKPLELLDHRLSRLVMKSSGWYAGLFKTLSSRYWDCHRFYQSDLPSGMKYLVVILPVETNSLIVLGVGGDLPTASLSLVTREVTSDASDSAHSCDVTEAADDSQLLHQLTEEFINCCCFYLWSSLLHG